MSDRPIIFSASMVRALLDGRKSQTRRIIKGVPLFSADYDRHWRPHVLAPGGSLPTKWSWWEGPSHGPSCYHQAELPYAVGDRLWVRENFSYSWSVKDDPERRHLMPTWFWADGNPDGGDFSKPKPSIHMPRWASSLTLAATDVRVERLQDISEEDAGAEGVETDVWDMAPVARRYGEPDAWFVGWSMGVNAPSVSVDAERVCRESFASLWNSINGPHAWFANPWVVAVSFDVIRANIDALPVKEAA